MGVERWEKAWGRLGRGLPMALMIGVTVVLGLMQIAMSVPVLAVLWLGRVLYRPSPLPSWAESATIDAGLVLRLAAGLGGLSPGTMGRIAVAWAQAGDVEAARSLLARAEARLERLSRIPRVPRWDDSVIPEWERKRLDEARRRFASVLLGQEQPLPALLSPSALSWVREPIVAGGAPLPPDPVRVLVGEGRFDAALARARALPRDAPGGQPALAMAIVAVGQHEAGDPQGAVASLAEAVGVARRFSNIWPLGDDSGYRERALASLAVLEVHVGDLDGARRTMGLILDQDCADQVCRDAGFILAGRGELRAALRFTWWIADREQKAGACLQLAGMLLHPGR